MMRVDLPKPLKPGESYALKLKMVIQYPRSIKDIFQIGLRVFPRKIKTIYTITLPYPRMCVYNDVEGWQNKQFLGQGEFTVGFGNFDVAVQFPQSLDSCHRRYRMHPRSRPKEQLVTPPKQKRTHTTRHLSPTERCGST